MTVYKLRNEVDLRDLWYEINDSKSIVVYCGAGVTADRTGVGWAGLIDHVATKLMQPSDFNFVESSQVCRQSEENGRENLSSSFKSWDKYFNDETIPLEAKATAAMSLAKNKDGTMDWDRLKKTFAQALYRDSGWHRGRTLPKLVDFIVISAYMGKNVSIITTNYDTYIEDAIGARLKSLDNSKKSKGVLQFQGLEAKRWPPKLSWVAYNSSSSQKTDSGPDHGVPFSGDEESSDIKIHYMHGRLPEKGELCGSLVFSEKEYADSHDRTTEKLIEWFSGGPTIIVGTSLTDTPLVRSLLNIKRRDEASRAGIYAIMQRTITDKSISKQFQLSRAETLGVKLVMYDSYNDIPNIFSNLIALCTQGVSGYGGKLPCELALEDWIGSTQKFSREISVYGYEMSSIIINEIFKNIIKAEEDIKIEFWFVGCAGGSLDKKVLRVWTNSVGPTFTTGLRREEDISEENGKKVASVKAYRSGMPEIISLDKLNVGFAETNDKEASVGRWKTFLAVPLSIPSKKYNVDIVVGVVTLASTCEMSDSSFCDNRSRISILSRGLDSNKKLIVDYMMIMGRNLAETILNWNNYVNLKSIRNGR